MKKLILFVLLFSCGILAHGQLEFVISPAGNQVALPNGTLNYTFGQAISGSQFGFSTLTIIEANDEPNAIKNVAVETWDVKIYPNPTSEMVNINTSGKFQYELYSLSGTLIQKKVSEETLTTINVSSLAHGTYILKLMNTKKTKTFKIMKY